MKEETGMDVEFRGIKGVLHERLYEESETQKLLIYDRAHKNLDIRQLKYGLMLFLGETTPKNLNIKESHEGEIKWFSLNHIHKEKVILSDLWMIKHLLSDKSKIYKGEMTEEEGKLTDMRIEIYGNHD